MSAVWALLVFGAVRVFDDLAAPAAVGTTVALVVALVVAVRSRRPRPLPLSWTLDLPTAVDLPAGPRRVLLLEAGMVGPE